MKKTLLIISGVLLVLILLVVGAVNFYFTNERLQHMVTPQLEQAVGRPVNVGSMSVSVFSTLPDAALTVQNLSIPGTKQDTLVTVGDLSIRVEILPLWYNKVNITQLTLTRPRFIYTVYKDGSTNLDFLTAADTLEKPSAPKPAPQDQPPSPADTSQTNIRIPELTIQNARFGYVDRSTDAEFIFDQLDADFSLEYARKIATRLKLDIGKLTAKMGGDTYIDGLPVSLTQQSVINLEREILTLNKGALSIRGLSLDLKGSVSDWSSKTGPMADLQFSSSSDNFSDLLKLAPSSYQQQLKQYKTRGSLALKGEINGPLGGASLPDYNLTITVQDGYLKHPDLSDPITDIQVDANADNRQLKLNTMTARAGSNQFSASGTIQNPTEPDKSRLNVSTDLSLDLATIKNYYPIDPDTLALRGQLSAKARIVGTPEQLQESVQEAHISLENGRIDYKRMGPPLTNLGLDAVIRGKQLNLKQFTVTSRGNTLKASGDVTDYLAEQPQFNLTANGAYDLSQTHHYYTLTPYIDKLGGKVTLDASIKGKGFDPLQWALNGRLQLDDVNARGDSLPRPLKNLNGELKVDPTSANLTRLAFKLGTSDFNMKGRLTHYKEFLSPGTDGPTPRLTGSYRSNTLNIDEFIDWNEESDPETTYPIELPDLKSSITANIDRLTVMGINFQNVQGKAGTSKRTITLKEASAKLFDGTIKGALTWTVKDPLNTHLDFKGSINKVEASAFFREFQMLGGKGTLHKYISGAFSTEISYQTGINRHLMPEITTTASSGSFGMTKARLKGHPLQKKVAAVLNTPQLSNLAMDQWKATYNIKDGVLNMKDVRLTSGNIGAELEGTQHLVKGTVDYRLKLYLPGRFKDEIASVITQKAANALTRDNGTVMVPLNVTGTLKSPKVKPDKETIKPIVQDFLKDKAKDVIKGFFK